MGRGVLIDFLKKIVRLDNGKWSLIDFIQTCIRLVLFISIFTDHSKAALLLWIVNVSFASC